MTYPWNKALQDKRKEARQRTRLNACDSEKMQGSRFGAPRGSPIVEAVSCMFLALYSTLLAVALLLSSPWWLWRMATTDRYRHGLAQRLGLVSPALRTTVAEARSEGRRLVWLHAVSVGEVLASVRLVQELEAALPNHFIVISTTTLTGQKLAQQRFGADRVFYLPLDFALPVRRYLRLLRPEALLLMESELWPRLLAECRCAAIPVAVLNARISDRSFPRYLRLRLLWRRIFSDVTLFLAQGEESAGRLRAIGAAGSQVRMPGNLKYDLPAPSSTPVTELIRAAAGTREIIVAGSTVAGSAESEEELVLSAMDSIWQLWPSVLLVLAPRHPERFSEAYSRAAGSSNRGVTSATELLAGKLLPDDPCQTILLDTLGDLASVYSLGKVAFIGGSLVPRGGHNPLEAARFGVPVVMGPFYENFREMVESMEEAKAIRIVDKRGTSDSLADAFFHLLMDQSLGQRGRLFFESQSGATARTIAALLPLLEDGA